MRPDFKYRLAEPDFQEADLEIVAEVLRSGWLIQGKKVAEFESALGTITTSAPHVAVSSGTAALHLAMLALEIGPGDLVYIPSFAWPSAANLALLLGAIPVFIDVLPLDGNIDPVQLRERIVQSIANNLGRPKAIVAVHGFGLACDIETVRDIANEYGLQIIEDAACSLGARSRDGKSVGLIGDIGIFSFHPRKSLTTGEGGSIASRHPELLERCRQLRDHGRSTPMRFVSPGLNYRMTEFQAALGCTQAARFDSTLRARQKLAAMYLRELSDCAFLQLPQANPLHTWQTYYVVCESKSAAQSLQQKLSESGIESGFPSHSAQSLSQFSSLPGSAGMPVSERLRDCGLALPLHSKLSEADVVSISKVVKKSIGPRMTSVSHEPAITS